MKKTYSFYAFAFALAVPSLGCARKINTIDASTSQPVVAADSLAAPAAAKGDLTPVVKTDAEWEKVLDPNTYRIMRKKGTERAFTGPLNKHKGPATFVCASCGLPLFDSDHKYDSGSGWPSFYTTVDRKNVASKTDKSHGMTRTEVLCARCGGHLGHLFDDGPNPTGLRYCINSASLKAMPKAKPAK